MNAPWYNGQVVNLRNLEIKYLMNKTETNKLNFYNKRNEYNIICEPKKTENISNKYIECDEDKRTIFFLLGKYQTKISLFHTQ